MGIASMLARDARSAGAVVIRDELDPAHVMLRPGNDMKLSKRLAKAATLLIWPPGTGPVAPVLKQGEPPVDDRAKPQ